MEVYFKPEHLNNLAMRMEVRANHIYILFIALLNMLSFTCSVSNEKKWQKYTGTLSGMLLLLAGIVATFAFIYEHQGDLKNRYLTLASVILYLTAVTGFVLNEITRNTKKLL